MNNLQAYEYFQDNKNQPVTLLFDGINNLTLKELMDLVRLVSQYGDINNINPEEL